MTEQSIFTLYSLIGVGVVAQSALAWEWGVKGLDHLRKHGPGPRIVFAFLLFIGQGVWMRISDLKFPVDSWQDCWPFVIALAVFVIARTRRTKELLKAEEGQSS